MAAELGLTESIQFKINELSIITKQLGKIDIAGIFEELNIYDSIFVPVISGSILIRDSIGLSSQIKFDGSESLLIDITKNAKQNPNNVNLSYKRAFRIYKQSNRSNVNFNSEMYILNFVSDELMYSDQQRINQSYEDTYTNIVKNILTDYLKVPNYNLQGIIDDTVGIRKLVIPNLKPLDAIDWCAKRSTDKLLSPNFLFYQNNTGFNFASLSTLFSNPAISPILFEPKNVTQRNAAKELISARNMEIVSQTNAIERTRSGVISGKYIGFDPMTRSIETKELDYNNHYNLMKHCNPNSTLTVIPNRANKQNIEEFDSRKSVWLYSTNRKKSNYIKKYDPTCTTKEENYEDYIFQRKALLKNLTEHRLKFLMPGNFQLTSGFNVDVTVPKMSIKEKGQTNEDTTITGKYLIVATRHIIGYQKHETIIEVASSSSIESQTDGTSQQTSEIINY